MDIDTKLLEMRASERPVLVALYFLLDLQAAQKNGVDPGLFVLIIDRDLFQKIWKKGIFWV